MNQKPAASRRDFLKRSALAGAAVTAGGLGLARSAHAAGSDVLRVALVGAGGRGAGAAMNILSTKANVRLVAVADAFEDRLESTIKNLTAQQKDRVDVPKDRRFVGLDACQKAIDCGVDLVLLCTPPGFRPSQFEAAVKAGKHIFMEKPVATDAPGVRRILAANREAKQKKLAVAVGHHLRHETKHLEVVKRIHDGAIGDVKYQRVYFNTSGIWNRARRPDQNEMQYQVYNWYHFTWLSGDHLVEQHVHDIDVGNWIKQAHPIRAEGMGGRQVRFQPGIGEIYDHHAVEFEYADGSRMFSYCRQIPGCWDSFSQHAHGTKGYASIEGHGTSELCVDGQTAPEVATHRRRPPGRDGRPGRRPGGRPGLQRGRFGRRLDHDRHPRPHGDLLGQDGRLGRGNGLAARPGPRPAHLGRRAEDQARPRRRLSLRHAGRQPGMVRIWSGITSRSCRRADFSPPRRTEVRPTSCC